MTTDNGQLTTESLSLIERAERGIVPADLDACAELLRLCAGMEQAVGCVRWMAIAQAKAATLWWSFALWLISGFGITGGAHRLWSHRSYTAGPIYRGLTMIANSIANQGSIWHWSRDHRTHHFHSETVADPHDAIRGFIFAHIGWLYLKKDKRVGEAGAKVNMDDLRQDGFVMFQKKWDPYWNILWCFAFPAIVASYGWGESGAVGVFVPGAVRYVWVLHMTWFVNSAAHLWGERPYDPKSNPAENPLVAIASIGEGWHNWHHKYPFDPRARAAPRTFRAAGSPDRRLP
jgi:stearoyl-CoA desaturase (delta-9 desaturase)